MKDDKKGSGEKKKGERRVRKRRNKKGDSRKGWEVFEVKGKRNVCRSEMTKDGRERKEEGRGKMGRDAR